MRRPIIDMIENVLSTCEELGLDRPTMVLMPPAMEDSLRRELFTLDAPEALARPSHDMRSISVMGVMVHAVYGACVEFR